MRSARAFLDRFPLAGCSRVTRRIQGKIPAAAVILAGGLSTRMGRDKAVLRLGGKRLVDRAVSFLHPLFPEILVSVGSRRLALPHGARAVRDRFPGRGPSAGIDAAFSETRKRFLFVMACDMPAVSPALIRLLWAKARVGNGAVPVSPRGVEPLFGFYHRDIARRLARDLAAGKNVPVHRLRTRRVPWPVVRRADPAGASFANLNRPADIAGFRRGARRATVTPERRC